MCFEHLKSCPPAHPHKIGHKTIHPRLVIKYFAIVEICVEARMRSIHLIQIKMNLIHCTVYLNS